MKRTRKLTRKQIKNAKDLLENLKDHKPASVPKKNRLTNKTKLVKALKIEVRKQEAVSAPKTTKPRKTKPMFSLSKYLERKEQKKHAHEHGHDHQH